MRASALWLPFATQENKVLQQIEANATSNQNSYSFQRKLLKLRMPHICALVCLTVFTMENHSCLKPRYSLQPLIFESDENLFTLHAQAGYPEHLYDKGQMLQNSD